MLPTKVCQGHKIHDTEVFVRSLTLKWYIEASPDPAVSTVASDEILCSDDLVLCQ